MTMCRMESTASSRARRGPVGGAAAEGGSGFRAGVAAYIAAHILRGQPFMELDLLPEQTVPLSMRLEAEEAIDDIVVELASGGTAFIQAKRTLNFGQGAATSLKATVEQWIALEAGQGVDPNRHRLVAVAAETSGPVAALGSALRRRRRRLAEPATSAERSALARVEGLLSDVDPAGRDRILASAVIWRADLEEADGLAARLGQALLEPGVVAVGSGLSAWRHLREEARDLARRRFGATLEDLVELLRVHPFDLVADSAGYAAARAEQRRSRVVAYRKRVREAGEVLDLRALGAALPPIPLNEMDARIECYEPQLAEREDRDDRSNNGGLPWALRRRGRALLLGLPGSGKSTALRAAAAHYASRPSWPLPLVVRLERLARLLDVRGFDDALLEAAVQDQPVEEQAPLREAAIDALRTGDAALFFDGLDETRDQRYHVVAGLQAELNNVDTAVEVLLSTRDVAYADAHTLGFRDLRLIVPDRPNETATAVLRATAENRGLRGAEARDWVGARADWVRDRLSTDRALGETPLMVVLLTLVAAEQDPGTLPHARAAVLERVVRDTVQRWEAGVRLHGQAPRLGSLEDTDAVNAAWAAYGVIGALVYSETDPSRASVVTAVAELFTRDFGLAHGLAVGAAEDALALWDEAGVFVADASRRVTARVRLFAELAEAMRVCMLPPDAQDEWVASAVADAEARQPLLLAASASPTVGNALAQVAAGSGSEALDVVIEAVRQGSELSPNALELLVQRLLEADGEDDDALRRRALALVSLPVRPQAQSQVLAFFNTLDRYLRTVVRAVAVERWPREDDSAAGDLLAALQLEPEPRPRRSGRNFFEALGPDPAYQEAVLVAAERLLAAGRDDVAELVAQRMHGVSMAAATRLRRFLGAAGYAGIIRRVDEELAAGVRGPDWEAIGEESDRAQAELFDALERLAPVVELTRVQRRRLDELVDLMRTTGFNRAPAGEATRGILRDGERMRVALRAAALLGGLDLGVVAGQAAELREAIATEDESQLGPWFMLVDGGSRLELDSWNRVDDPVSLASSLAAAVGSRYPWIGQLATRCLRTTPERARAAALEQLDADLSEAVGRSQFLVALTMLMLSDDPPTTNRLQENAAAPVRRAVARYRGAGEPQVERASLLALLEDDDAGVREDAARALGRLGIGQHVREELEAALAGSQRWQCLLCGTTNVAEAEHCSDCGRSAPALADAIEGVLSGVHAT